MKNADQLRRFRVSPDINAEVGLWPVQTDLNNAPLDCRVESSPTNLPVSMRFYFTSLVQYDLDQTRPGYRLESTGMN